MASTSTLPVSPDDRPLRVDVVLRIALYVLLAAVVLLSLTGRLGASTAVTTATADGVTLEVTHAGVTRPGISIPLEIAVSRPGGLPREVTVEIDSEYLLAFDLNALSPQPTTEFNDGDRRVWTFEVPAGATRLAVAADARLDPSVQSPLSADVSVILADAAPLTVTIDTRVLP